MASTSKNQPAPPEEELNDWESFVHGLKSFWTHYGQQTLLIVLIGVAAYVVYGYVTTMDERRIEEAYSQQETASSVARLVELARSYGDSIPGFAGNTYLMAGDLKLREALGTGVGVLGEPADEATRRRMLEEAAGYYQKAVDLNESPLQVVAARFGLASAYESMREFDKAREQYAKIQSDPNAWSNHVNSAQSLAKNLKKIAEPVEFPQKPAEAQKEPEPAGPPPLLKRPETEGPQPAPAPEKKSEAPEQPEPDASTGDAKSPAPQPSDPSK